MKLPECLPFSPLKESALPRVTHGLAETYSCFLWGVTFEPTAFQNTRQKDQ